SARPRICTSSVLKPLACAANTIVSIAAGDVRLVRTTHSARTSSSARRRVDDGTTTASAATTSDAAHRRSDLRERAPGMGTREGNIESTPMHVLGIDAGGTKTVCLLADARGEIVSEARGGGANLHSSGEREVEKVLRDVMETAIGDRAIAPAAVCVGIAGVDREDE